MKFHEVLYAFCLLLIGFGFGFLVGLYHGRGEERPTPLSEVQPVVDLGKVCPAWFMNTDLARAKERICRR